MPPTTVSRDELHEGYIDLDQHELRNAVVQNLSAAPSSPLAGQLYYDTDDGLVLFWNGSTWTAGGSSYTDEQARDAIGAALVAGNNIDIVVNDAGDTITIDVEALTSADLGDFAEAVSDQVGTMVAGNTETGITVTYQDSDNTLDFAVSTLDLLPAPAGSLSLNSQKITNLLDGTGAQDAVSLSQVQGLIATGTNKTAVRAGSTSNVAIATALENGDSFGGVTLATGDRVVLMGQTAGAENGIYVVPASGAASRATDADISAEVKGGLTVWINEGTLADSRWTLTTNDPIVLGTTALTFVQDFAANATNAGAGLTATGNVLSVNVDGGTLGITSDELHISSGAAGNGLTGGGPDGALAVGAGLGIAVGADDVAVDRATQVGRVMLVSDGALTGGANSEVITHHACARKLLFSLCNNASPFDEVDVHIERTTSTTTTVYAASGQNLPAGYIWTVGG